MTPTPDPLLERLRRADPTRPQVVDPLVLRAGAAAVVTRAGTPAGRAPGRRARRVARARRVGPALPGPRVAVGVAFTAVGVAAVLTAVLLRPAAPGRQPLRPGPGGAPSASGSPAPAPSPSGPGATSAPPQLSTTAPPTDPASGAVHVSPDGGHLVVTITDVLADPAAVTRAAATHGVRLYVRFVPVAPTEVGKVLGGAGPHPKAVRVTTYDRGRGAAVSGDVVVLRVPAGAVELGLLIGRRARPGERWEPVSTGLDPGEPLHCLAVRGRRVHDVSAAIGGRGIRATWVPVSAAQLARPATGRPIDLSPGLSVRLTDALRGLPAAPESAVTGRYVEDLYWVAPGVVRIAVTTSPVTTPASDVAAERAGCPAS